jgi:hypothetical protein
MDGCQGDNTGGRFTLGAHAAGQRPSTTMEQLHGSMGRQQVFTEDQCTLSGITTGRCPSSKRLERTTIKSQSRQANTGGVPTPSAGATGQSPSSDVEDEQEGGGSRRQDPGGGRERNKRVVYKDLDWELYTESSDEESEQEPLWDDDGDEEAEMCQEDQLSEGQVRYTATPEDASSASEQWRLRLPEDILYGSNGSGASDEFRASDEEEDDGSSADGDAPYHDRRSTDTDQLNMTIPDGRMGNAIPKRRGSSGFSNHDRGDEPILGRETGMDEKTTGNRIPGVGGGA